MKKSLKIRITILALTVCFAVLSCNELNANPRPTKPEDMSPDSALRFFIDNDIRAGWNLGNTLDAVRNSGSPSRVAEETAWGNPRATQELLNGVRAAGFDIVRIPVTWIGHIGSAPNYTVSTARLQRVAEVIEYARKADFKAVIINIHHDGNYTQPNIGTWGFLDFAGAVNNNTKKMEIENQLARVWTQIAEEFKNYGDFLIFETVNEVHSGNWGTRGPNETVAQFQHQQDILFDWNQAALNAIRATGGNNATRYVAIPTLGSTEPEMVVSAHSRGKLLPNDPGNGTDRLIVSVHYYHPWRYTVASATGQAGSNLIHTWGTSSDRSHLNNAMASLKTNFLDKGIAVYIGEWGAPTNIRSSMSQTIRETHIDYIRSVATAARANGIVPIYWDDGGQFKMLERLNGRPRTGLWEDTLSAMITALIK